LNVMSKTPEKQKFENAHRNIQRSKETPLINF